jgi:eukaryotic-like serine/threonine-protein kinase
MRSTAGGDERSADSQALWLPQPGELVAERFLVEAVGGTGGMGAVFRARDLASGAAVALKLVRRLSGTAFERFTREARVLSELAHPAVVRFVAYGSTAQGAQYLAMEWLEGEDLSQTLSRTSMSPAQSLALLQRVCEGLALAHERGIVHRDLKPSNLFVVGSDLTATKILDFGLAREAARSQQTLTRGGSVLGTVGYMAPEQAMGVADVDARADVFSLGCVLFECLTGRGAFVARHDVAVLAKVLRAEPERVSQTRPELAGPLDELVARMLAKDRYERPKDAAELLQALRATSASVGACAEALPSFSRITASERRVVTIILARSRVAVATMTSAGAKSELEQLEQLARRFEADYFPIQGDGLLLSLSGPLAATDQACRAASCALALKRMWPHMEVVVTTGGLDSTAFLPVGEAIDNAALLLEQSTTPQPGVVLDELTHGLLNGRFDVQRIGVGALLLGELDEVELPRPLLARATPCVGRDKELALLQATFEECADDSVARAVLITGAPGIGKSRLARAFLDRLRTRENVRVIVARAEAMAEGSALSLAKHLLRRAAGLRSADAGEVQRACLHDYLALLPLGEPRESVSELIAECLDLNEDVAPSPRLRAARNDPQIMHAQLLRAFTDWLAAESALRPCVLLLEDLQWADSSSMVYLERALAPLRTRPVLLVALGRPELRERFPELHNLAELQEIRLGGLTRRAADRLTRMMLPEHDERALSRIVERADGNAFYLEELIRWVAEGRRDLPDTVLAMARSRLEALELDARRVLRAVSVFGAGCSTRAVVTLLGEDCDAPGWLAALVQREILVRRRESRLPDDLEYEFRHALLRDAAYAMLTDSDRQVAHRVAGYWLLQAGERDPRVLADHFERARAWDMASLWQSRAALQTLEAGDLDGALELAQRGFEHAIDGEARGTFMLLRGYVAAFRTRADDASLQEALRLLPVSSPHWWLAVSTLVFSALASGSPAQAQPFVQLALTTEPGPQLTGSYGAALQTMCTGMVMIGQPGLAATFLERYRDASSDDPHCDPMFVAWLELARCQLATTCPQHGHWELERALLSARAAVSTMRTLGSASGLATALFYLGYASRIVGLYRQAGEALEESIACAERSGLRLIEQYAKLILVLVRLHHGAFDETFGLLAELTTSSNATVAHGANTMLAEARFRVGDLVDACKGAQASLDGPSVPYRRVAFSTLARAQLGMNELGEALATVERALAGPAAATPEYTVDLLTTRARAYLLLGDTARGKQAHDSALELVDAVALRMTDEVVRGAFVEQLEASLRARELRV